MIKINLVKDRVERIRTTPEKLHPVLFGLLVLVYISTLGLAIVGNKRISEAAETAESALVRAEEILQNHQPAASDYTEEDLGKIENARRLLNMLQCRTRTWTRFTAVGQCLPEGLAFRSFQMNGPSGVSIGGTSGTEEGQFDKIWSFKNELKVCEGFKTGLKNVNLETVTGGSSSDGKSFVISASFEAKSLTSEVRKAH